MPAKKRSHKKTSSKNKLIVISGKVTARTWTLFGLFLLASVFTFYRISLASY